MAEEEASRKGWEGRGWVGGRWEGKSRNGEGRRAKRKSEMLKVGEIYFLRLIGCLNLSTAKLSSIDVSESLVCNS